MQRLKTASPRVPRWAFLAGPQQTCIGGQPVPTECAFSAQLVTSVSGAHLQRLKWQRFMEPFLPRAPTFARS